MRYLISYIIIAVAAMAFASCTQTDGSQHSKAEAELLKAEQLAAEGNDSLAYQCAISLTDTSKYDLLPSQLCRQALLLFRLSNEGENAERLVAALTCYERALTSDPDSVEAFVNALAPDDRTDLKFVHDLNMRLNHPQDYSEYEEDDEFVTPSDSSLIAEP